MRIWQELADPTAVTAEAAHLIDCATRCGAAAVVIRFCEQLRRNRVYAKRFLEAELFALEKVSFQRLTVAIEDILASPVDEGYKRLLRAHLSYVSIFTGRADLIENDQARLPAVGELKSVREGRLVVEVLRHGRPGMYALQYAYELYRRFPDELHAHLAVIHATGLPAGQPVAIPQPDAAKPGVAVHYKEDDSGHEHWCVIEDAPTRASAGASGRRRTRWPNRWTGRW